MVASINSSTSADRAQALFTRIDSKNQGYIDKAELESALSKNGKGNSTSRADRLFEQLDSDKDGKVTQSELSDALNKVSDQLRSQLNQSRAHRGGEAPPPPPPPPPGDGGGTTTGTDPADTNGDGTVSDAEAAAYAAQQASSGTTSTTTTTTTTSTTTTTTGTSAAKGLSLEQLTAQRDALPASDTRRQAALGKLIDNFAAADTNGDGKLSRHEGRDYLKANRPEGGRQDSGFDAFARALNSLRGYANVDNSTTTTSTTPTVDTSA